MIKIMDVAQQRPEGTLSARTAPPSVTDGGAFFSISAAAARLMTSPEALRARCRRNARRDGRVVSAHLGGDIVAIKFGVSWRIRFPD